MATIKKFGRAILGISATSVSAIIRASALVAMVKAARSAAIAVERATQKQLQVVAAVATLLAGSVMVQASAPIVAARVSVLGVAVRDGRQEGTNASKAEGILPTASVRLAGGMAVVRSVVETGSYSFR